MKQVKRINHPELWFNEECNELIVAYPDGSAELSISGQRWDLDIPGQEESLWFQYLRTSHSGSIFLGRL